MLVSNDRVLELIRLRAVNEDRESVMCLQELLKLRASAVTVPTWFRQDCSLEMRAYLTRSHRLLGIVDNWPTDFVLAVVADLACEARECPLKIDLGHDALEALHKNNKHAFSDAIAREFRPKLAALLARLLA